MLAEARANVRNDLLTLNVVTPEVWTCSVVIDLFSDFMLICRGNERQRSDVEGDKVTPALTPFKLGVYIRILGSASPVLFSPFSVQRETVPAVPGCHVCHALSKVPP